MLSLLIETFSVLPIGQTVIPSELFAFIIKWSSMTFLGAVLIALPVMVSLLFINQDWSNHSDCASIKYICSRVSCHDHCRHNLIFCVDD